MKCPVCNTTLNIVERQGVEVDFCPECHGVWLERGELDKIIERSHNIRTMYQLDDADDDWLPERDRKKKSGRRSFLDDLFDFS